MLTIVIRRVGETRTGRGLYKLVHAKGHVFGHAFCLTKQKRAKPAQQGA